MLLKSDISYQNSTFLTSQEEVVYFKYKQSSAINRLYANLSKTCPGLLENSIKKLYNNNINVE